jgi:hypothetical protein
MVSVNKSTLATICLIYLNFITSCANSDSLLARFITQHGVQVAHMFSPIGKNFYLCADWFRFTSEDLNLLTRPKVIVDQYYQAQKTEVDLICARQVLKLIFVHDGVLSHTAVVWLQSKWSFDFLIIFWFKCTCEILCIYVCWYVLSVWISVCTLMYIWLFE